MGVPRYRRETAAHRDRTPPGVVPVQGARPGAGTPRAAPPSALPPGAGPPLARPFSPARLPPSPETRARHPPHPPPRSPSRHCVGAVWGDRPPGRPVARLVQASPRPPRPSGSCPRPHTSSSGRRGHRPSAIPCPALRPPPLPHSPSSFSFLPLLPPTARMTVLPGRSASQPAGRRHAGPQPLTSGPPEPAAGSSRPAWPRPASGPAPACGGGAARGSQPRAPTRSPGPTWRLTLAWVDP